MDPVTHALLGSAVARTAFSRPLGRAAWLPGAAGALLPDADAAIRSAADPLLYAEFHRHFTHSLAFIPIGGALASLPWVLRRSTRSHWMAYVGAATAGYATHSPLDASTTYGTRLLWPFSDERLAWNWISIVDPLFTLLLLAGVLLGVWRRSVVPLLVVLALCAGYIGAGALQRTRALDAQRLIAASRGHARERADVFPAFATTIVWRSLYRSGDRLHMDRIRVPPWGTPSWSAGPSFPAFDADRPDTAALSERHRRDLTRFAHFSNRWTARAPGEPALIGDARYSLTVEAFVPVWGIRLRSGAGPPVEWVNRSAERRVSPAAMWQELRGTDSRYRPVEGWGAIR